MASVVALELVTFGDYTVVFGFNEAAEMRLMTSGYAKVTYSIKIREFMKDNEKEDNKFTWGDSALVKKNAPKHYHPREFASICGITKNKTEKLANLYHSKINTWVYTIEFEDGSSIEIPEYYLEPYEEKNQ
jgi:hypothetical protein